MNGIADAEVDQMYWVGYEDGNVQPMTKMELLLLLMNTSIRNRIKSVSVNKTLTPFDLGPKRDALCTVVLMTVVYTLLFITGVIGNICTCVVISRHKYMHTATNYYLFSLAISDLLLLILGLPDETYQLWIKYPYQFGEAFCLFRGLTSEMSTNASILTITAFTIERYIAICRPLKAHTKSKPTRAVKYIVIIWLCAGTCAAPLAAQFGIVYSEVDNKPILESARCAIKRPLKYSFEMSTLLFFLLPMMVIVILYVIIALELRRTSAANWFNSETEGRLIETGQSKSLKRQESGSSNQTSRRDVVKMLVAVVIAFFVCWAPFHAQRLMATHLTQPSPVNEMAYTVLNYTSGITYYVSATINPILYSILSVKFREGFRNCCNRRTQQMVYSFRCVRTNRTSIGCELNSNSTKIGRMEEPKSDMVVSYQNGKSEISIRDT